MLRGILRFSEILNAERNRVETTLEPVLYQSADKKNN